MKEFGTNLIKNVALVSHGGAGKTSLGEAMLFVSGAITRMGSVQEGNTVSDFEDEEIRRNISLSTGLLPVEYKDHKINILDTPGFADFIGEVISALRISDAALVLVDSVAGIEVGTEIVWNYCDQYELPRFVVLCKMDRDNSGFQRTMTSLKTLATDATFIPVQLPWGEKQAFKGVIDLFTMQARSADGTKSEPIPEEFEESAMQARTNLIEAAAEGDDDLLEKYLNGEDLTAEEISRGFKQAVMSGQFIPVFLTAGTANVGTVPLMEAIIELLPSPAQIGPIQAQGAQGAEELEPSTSETLAAFVWKTTADPFVGKLTYIRVYSGTLSSDSKVWNQSKETEERFGTIHVLRGKDQMPVKLLHAGDIATVSKLSKTGTGDTLCEKSHRVTLKVPSYPNALYSVAVMPKTQADSTKMGGALTRLSEEDPTLSWHQEMSTNQTILDGMGDQHIDVAIRKAESKFQVGLNTEMPKVPYRETITAGGSAMYRHKKQTGGSGQFAEVHLRVMPLEDSDFEFKNKVFGGSISSGYMPAIEKGVKGVLILGALAGYPISKVRVEVFDGKEHPVDSKAVAFEIAGREAFKLAFADASPVMLEPIMDIEITVPQGNMGDVLGDLNTRRARVQGMESDRGRSVVTAQVPLAEIVRYVTDLRSITGGRGVFSMSLSHYQIVPPHVTEDIIADQKKASTQEGG